MATEFSRGVQRLVRALLRVAPKVQRPAGTCGRRAVLLHFDGVSRVALDAAIANGSAPFLARLVDSRLANVDTYRVGAPASTSQFQAGLLYGRVDDVPGYLWYDKKRKRNVRMDRGEDARAVEKRHNAKGPGLLVGGVSYTTLFDGCADVPAMNLPRTKALDWKSNSPHWPFSTAALVHGALGVKLWSQLFVRGAIDLVEGAKWAARVGRHDWEWRLYCMRQLTRTMREITGHATVVDMALGTPVIYACLVDYDEVAHRRGPLAEEPMRHLRAADRIAEMIFCAAEELPHLGYDVYVIADHGQTPATPFPLVDPEGRDFPAFLRAVAEGADASREHVRLRALGDRLPPPASWIVHERARKHVEPPRGVEVIDAGDIAHLYFTDHPEPLPIDAIERLQPRILAALQTSPATPFLTARSAHGPVVLSGTRTFRLAEPVDRAALASLPALRGRDVETLARYLERVISMPSSGDLVVYGNAGEHTIAYSWEFGSHGGIAPREIDAFVLKPANVDHDFTHVTVPEELYRWFVRYRPLLPRKQDTIYTDEENALRAILDGDAYADPSADTLNSSCH